jgi:5-methylcytosine-specific restriction enzyme A
MRAEQLRSNPLCRMHEAQGRVVAATVADHIEPHKGDEEKFFDANNLQSLCKPCHDSHKQSQEATGYLRGNDTKGQPLDPNHHWNKK